MDKLTLTSNAISFIQKKLESHPKAVGMRISITKGGCSGSMYDINFAEQREPEDIVVEKEGIKVMIDPVSLKYLEKTEIDCIKDDFGEYLKFRNPNVKGECGCGESISFEN